MLNLFKSKKQSYYPKILIVDDEPDLVETVRCRLEWCKYEVVIANNGQEGLEKASSEKPDLILLDIDMPVMNGHQMLERLKNNQDLKDIPVIMCTALCAPQDIDTASSYGIVDYITKPFDYTELVEKMSNALKVNSLR